MNKKLVSIVRVYTHTHGIYNILVIGKKSVKGTDYINVQGIGI